MTAKKRLAWQDRGIVNKICAMPGYTDELLSLSYSKSDLIQYNTKALFLPSSIFVIKQQKLKKCYYIKIL